MTNTKFKTQEGSNQNMRFLNDKRPYPPETKANHKLHLKSRQIKSSAKLNQTPPEEENKRFYQLSLGKPQDKHRPLKKQSKSMH
jgi:hypothetical protein